MTKHSDSLWECNEILWHSLIFSYSNTVIKIHNVTLKNKSLCYLKEEICCIQWGKKQFTVFEPASWLYLAQVDHGEDVWLGFSIYDPLSLPGDVLVLWAKRRHLRLNPPRPEQRHIRSTRVNGSYLLLLKSFWYRFWRSVPRKAKYLHLTTYLLSSYHQKQEGSYALWELVLNIPKANEELVLQQYGEDEEDNTFSCHCEQIFSYKVPLKRVKSLLRAWRRKTYFLYKMIYHKSCVFATGKIV